MCDQKKFKLLKQVGLQRPYRIVDISPKCYNLEQILQNFEFNKTKNQTKFPFRKVQINQKETINLSMMKRKIVNQFNQSRINRSLSRKYQQQNNTEQMSPFFRICHYSGSTEPSSPSVSRITPKFHPNSVERYVERKKTLQPCSVQRNQMFSDFDITAWSRKSSVNV